MNLPASPRTAVATIDAPRAIGPCSQAIRYGDVLYCSGALPLDPATKQPVTDSVAGATARCLQNLEAVCRAASTELARAVRVTVYTTRLDRVGEINEAYAAFFGGVPPARVTVGV